MTDEKPPLTPGPWRAVRIPTLPDTYNVVYDDAKDGAVGVANLMSPANARLIAAAPSLYEALTDCLYALTSPVAGPTDMASAATRARQAIRLVEGE